MLKNKVIFLIGVIILITSCETMGSVKRGLTGEKVKSTDEFLVQKKDPLILPPDYENLPTPDENEAEKEDASSFEKKLTKISSNEEETSSTANSSEQSILEQIRKK